ncbi:flavocytochrome c [Apilactobacillus apinorum]|uniref:flavocytochrome c n=1 Tax=Apilactobacillus apinorum TaxID=1218495 RepID=UPI0006B40A19|nr:flavocytochrome c [Apilactobacillus apinorum]KOY68447.1 Fumarate reductase flavoprotein subunit [Apilactobacillus apinorum]CAI2685820.1 Fumarate reductase flavoprotein subunit [Apilactobacillus apinorum]
MAKYVFEPNQIADLKSEYDVIIVGSGATGLISAIQAAELGLKPVVFEKMDKLGGNSTRASSGMNAAETYVQLNHHVVDSFEDFYNDTYIGGGKQNNVELLKYFTSHAGLTIDWLKQHGIELEDLTITGAMNTTRTHRPNSQAPIGAYLVTSFLQIIEKMGIEVYNNVSVDKITRDDEKITGVVISDVNGNQHQVAGKAVLLATGGFGANKELIGQYRKDLTIYRTTNQEGATGDGLKLATDVGAALVDMDQIQVHPTVQQDNDHAFLIGEAIRGEGAILVNTDGNRFVNELDTRQKVTDAINEQDTKHAYLILDAEVVDHAPAVRFYDSIGMVVHGQTIDELANNIDVDADNLAKTIETWNQAVVNHDDQFGRKTGMNRQLNHPDFMAIHIAPAVHYTMGGIKINHYTQVLNQDDQAINGLFAAGETSGGLHGNNRIGGNSIAETVVFGRQAGQRIFKYIQEQ